MKLKNILLALLLFTTVAASAQVTLMSENFNATSTDSIPAGWSNGDYVAGTSPSTTILNYLWKTTEGGVGGTHCASLTASHAFVHKARLKSSAITLPSLQDAYLSFSLRNSKELPTNGIFNIYVSTDGGTTYITNPIDTNISTGPDWQTYTYPLDAYRGQTVTLVFEGCSSGNISSTYLYYLDDVKVAEKPTCQPPTGLYIYGLTNSSVNLSWLLDSRFGAAPDLYSITLKDAGGNVIIYDGSYSNLSEYYSFTNLTPNTTYTASVRSNCQAISYQGFSDSVSISFTTLPLAVNAPYYEDFNSIATLPAGFYHHNAFICSQPNYTYGNTGNSLKMATTPENNAFVAFPVLNLRGGDIEMDFMIRRESAESAAVGVIPFKAGYLTDPSDIGGTFIALYFGSLSGDASWRNIRFQISDSTDQTTPVIPCIFIDAAFVTSVYVDNFSARAVPSCIRPEDVAVTSITSNSAVIDWSSSNSSIAIRTKNTATSAVVTQIATQHPYTLTGLNPQTQYDITIAAVCSPGDTSDYTLPIRVKTLCAAATSPLMNEGFEGGTVADCWTMGWFSHPQGATYKETPFAISAAQKLRGLNSLVLERQPAGTVSYLSSYALPFDVAGKYDVKLNIYRENTPQYPAEGVSLWITPTAGDTTGGVRLARINRHYLSAPAETATGWHEYAYNIPVQGSRYITIVGYSQNGSPLYVDDLQIVLAPTCRKVAAVAGDTLSSNAFSVRWSAGGSEQQWLVDYTLLSGATMLNGSTLITDTTITLATPSLTISNLLLQTQYSLSGSIRALCGNNDTSEAAGFSYAFATPDTVIIPPTCAGLDGSAMVSDNTSTSVKVTLYDLTATTGWSYSYGPAGNNVATMVTADTIGGTIVITGLAPATQYDLYVRRSCGSGDYSVWSGAVRFSTLSTPAAMPYICGFENSAENAQWIFAEGDGTTNFVIGSASTAVYSGTNALYASKDNGNSFEYQHGDSKCFAYRTLHFDDKGYQIEYKWKATGGEVDNDFGRVMIVPAATTITGGTGTQMPANAIFIDPEGKTQLNLTTGDAFGWNSVSQYVDMTGRAGDYNLVVMWTNNISSGMTSTPLSVDDINIYELGCIPPSSVVVANLTSTGATLTFTAVAASQYEVIIDTLPIDIEALPDAPLIHDTIQTNSITLTNLTPNTDYYYTIRSYCANGDTSTWRRSESFRTYCVSATVPYSESFEQVATERCWSANLTSGYIIRTGSASADGYNSMLIYGADAISPEFAVDSLARYMVSGWAMSPVDSALLGVGVMVDPDDISTYENVSSVMVPEAGRWVEFAAYFSVLNTPEYADFVDAKHIVFAASNTPVYLDLIQVDAIPSCPKPTQAYTTNITDTSFTISFVDNASASAWVVYANGVPHTVTSTTATITGLKSSTDYVVKVAAICSLSDTSATADCGVIHTSCGVTDLPYRQSFETLVADDTAISMIDPLCWLQLNVSTTAPFQPSFCANTAYFTEGQKSLQLVSKKNVSLYMIMPIFETVQNPLKVSFDVKYMNTTKCGVVKVGYMTDVTSAASFVEAGSTIRQTQWTRYDIVIPSLPANARVAIMLDDDWITYGTNSNYNTYIDNFVVQEVLSCSEPSQAAVTNITSTSASVSFADTDEEHVEWQYVVGTSTTDPDIATPVTVTATNFSPSGLNPETDYYLYVRTVCDVGEYSNWVLTRFTTLCAPYAVTVNSPYSDSFEDLASGDHLGGCYTVTDVSANYYPKGVEDYADNYDVYYYSRTGTHCLMLTNLVSNAPEGQNAYRQFHLEAGQIYRASVYYRYTQAGNRASLVMGPTGDSLTVVAYADNEGCGGILTTAGVYYYDYHTCWQQLSANISVAQTGDYFIGLRAERSPGRSGSFSMYFDDFTVTQMDGCLPTQSTVDSVAADRVWFHIADRDTSHRYQYAVVHDLDTVIPPTIINGIIDSCGGLNPSTTYRLMVRQRCADGNYSDWSTVDFATSCQTVNVYPVTESFESTIFPPACWSMFSYGTPAHTWATTANEMYVKSGTRAASVVRGSAGAKVALVTNELNLTSPYGYYVRFSMYRSISDGDKTDEALHLMYSTVPVTSASLAEANEIAVINRNVQLPPVEADNLSGYYDYEYEIPAGVMGTVWVVFDFHCQYGGAIFIDDVVIEPKPSCVAPRQAPVVASRTMTTATVTVPMDGRQQAEVVYALSSAPDSMVGSIVTVNGKAVVTGLTASTSYVFCSRYICAAGDTSEWSPVAQTTTMATDCFEPQNLRICGITNNHSATVTWNPAPLATGYEYILTKGGVVVDSAVTTADTLRFSGLDMSSAYTVRVRTHCSDGPTGWSLINFSTTFTTSTVPFVCGFENAIQNSLWQLRNVENGANSFVIGNGVSRNGNGSLYISNDSSTYHYNISSTSGADAEALIEMPAGRYYVEYDWLCNAELNYDFGRVFLVPATIQLNDIRVTQYYRSLPAGAISLDNNSLLNLKTEWQHYVGIVDIPADALYKLVVLFACDSRGGVQQPLAVDNFHIQRLCCMPVTAVNMITVNANDAVAVVAKSDADVPMEYGYSVYDEADSVKIWQSSNNGAMSDTLHLTGLQTSTTYWLYVRHVCSSDSISPIVRRSFTTAMSSVAVPFICSFEAGETSLSKWHYASGGSVNAFVVGSSAASDGINSLYISNDGTNHYYDNTAATWSYAYIPVAIRAGIVGVSYDWNCQGENNRDYARVFFVPSSTVLNGALDGLTSSTLPSDCIALDDGRQLALSAGWTQTTAEHTFANDNTYLMVVAWRNDNTGGLNYPIAIDNIKVYDVTCPMISAEDVEVATTTTSISLSAGVAMEYALYYDASYTMLAARGVTVDGNALMTALHPSTRYFIALRKICAPGDTSAALRMVVRTDCGPRTVYPYTEGFESIAAGSTDRDQMLDHCWTVSSRYTSSYHYVNNSTRHSGSNSFTIYNGANQDSYQTFGLPEVDTLAGKRISVWYRNYSGTASTYALLQVGYMMDTSFVMLASAPFNNSGYTEFVYDYPLTVPDAARPAFRALGTHFLHIDDIRISRVVQGSVYSDTLCHNSPYTDYGFVCPAGTLHDGDTLLIRTQRSDVAGTADTIVTVNLHIYPEFLTQYKDTVCAGYPYVKGMWNISNPVSQVYRYTWQGSQTASGCDSTVYLDLTVLSFDTTVNVSFCKGGSVTVVDTLITTPGTYTLVRPNGAFCDMTYHITAMELPLIVVGVSDVVCEGYPYTGNGITNLIVTGDTVVYVTTSTWDNSCDSLTEVSLSLVPTVYGSESATITSGESYIWNGKSYAIAGEYVDTLASVVTGCDSVVTLNLSVVSGLEKVEMFEVALYPNPAKSGEPIHIYLDAATSIFSVDILTSTDKIIDCSFSTEHSQLLILNSQLPPGFYFVRIITDGNKVYVRKLIVR